jgi:hypothetical protein
VIIDKGREDVAKVGDGVTMSVERISDGGVEVCELERRARGCECRCERERERE